MNLRRRLIRAIVRKELREYRHNRSLVVTMAILPLVFLLQPLVAVVIAPASSAAELGQRHLLLYMLGIPVLVPSAMAATAVVGERQQATLEPMLTTPIRREEFLLGKALGVFIPTIVVAYAVYAVYVICVLLFAQPGVGPAILQAPDLVAQVIFTPLLALWSIWAGLAISVRSSDVRVAQQLSLLGSIPLVLFTSLLAFDVIHATLGIALGAGALLLLADGIGWRVVAPMFDRERLITGTK